MSQRASLIIQDGFGGRAWLTEAEWETYRRRVAVRYPQNLRPQVAERDGEACSVCGRFGDLDGKPIQLAHRVPFKIGVVDWGLTPDWLDGVDNLCLAHQGACNDQAEVRQSEIPAHLRGQGLALEDSPAVASGLVSLSSGPGGD